MRCLVENINVSHVNVRLLDYHNAKGGLLKANFKKVLPSVGGIFTAYILRDGKEKGQFHLTLQKE